MLYRAMTMGRTRRSIICVPRQEIPNTRIRKLHTVEPLISQHARPGRDWKTKNSDQRSKKTLHKISKNLYKHKTTHKKQQRQ